jgi:hypothetical protein
MHLLQVPLTARSTVVHVAQPVQPGAAPKASAPAPVSTLTLQGSHAGGYAPWQQHYRHMPPACRHHTVSAPLPCRPQQQLVLLHTYNLMLQPAF